jgi:Fe-S cluster assembly protein SufD
MNALPNRRTEAWKYSDLAAALPEVEPPPGHGHIIARLNGGTTRSTVARGREMTLVERFDLDGLDARALHVDVSAGATLTRIVIQKAGEGVPLCHTEIVLAEGARYRQFVLAEGARLARIEVDVRIEGEGADVDLSGVYLVGSGRHADLTSRVEHRVRGGATRQLIKGAAKKGGRGVFQGKILVAAQAQKTDARQNHHALLLEDGAEVFAKPELEIYADDVACAHGNSVGALDANALFYMRQRGLPEPEARALLVKAFLEEAVPEWLPDDIRAEVLARIEAGLGGAP